jgi:hypothetical protein
MAYEPVRTDNAQLAKTRKRIERVLESKRLSREQHDRLLLAKEKIDDLLGVEPWPEDEPPREQYVEAETPRRRVRTEPRRPSLHITSPPTRPPPNFSAVAIYSRRRAPLAFKLAAILTVVTGMYHILNFLSLNGIHLLPFTLAALFVTQYVSPPENWFTLSFVVPIVAWSGYGLAYAVAKARGRGQEGPDQEEPTPRLTRPKGESSQLQYLDDGIDDLLGSEEAEEPEEDSDTDTDLENGDLPPDVIDRIVAGSGRRRLQVAFVVKSVSWLVLVYAAFWMLTNLDKFIAWGFSIIFWVFIIMQLHQTYPALMGILYTTLMLFIGVIYLVPYRMMRKEIRVVFGRQTKTLGRKVFVKGSDEHGQPTPGMAYTLWYGWRWLAHKLGRNRHTSWHDARPHPHEFPFGDVYYLRGSPLRGIPKYRYAIAYKSNVLGIIRRQIHLKILYTNSKIEQSMFVIRLIGDGVNVLEVPRGNDDGIPHQELSPFPMQYRPRPRGPYSGMVDSGLEMSAGRVDRGVRSDAELAKESVREFTLPAPAVVYRGLSEDDVGPAPPPNAHAERPNPSQKPETDVDEEGNPEPSDNIHEVD